jgi:hypothetical protein
MTISILFIVLVLALLLFGLKLARFVNAQKIVSGVVLVCIVLPTAYWFWGTLRESVDPDKVVISLYDSIQSIQRLFNNVVGDAKYRQLDDELARNNERIVELEELLTELNPEQSHAYRSELNQIEIRCEQIFVEQAEILDALNRQRIEDEKIAILQRRKENNENDIRSLDRVVRLEWQLQNQFSMVQNKKAAEVFSRFIESVSEQNVEQAQALVVPKLRNTITVSMLNRLQSAIPEVVENGFELRKSNIANAVEVHAGTKLATLLSEDGKTWLITEIW